MLAVKVHASMNPDGAGELAMGLSGVSAASGLSYADSGGNVSNDAPKVDEYAAEANKYGMGTSSAVKASGSENHDADAVGISSKVGLYTAALGIAGRPRSDSPLGRELFMGENE